jgi:hypothetical protein
VCFNLFLIIVNITDREIRFMGFLTGKTAIITGAGRAVLNDGRCGIDRQIKTSDNNMDYIKYRIIRKDGSIRWI